MIVNLILTQKAPEAPWNLAGGASHRIEFNFECTPAGSAGSVFCHAVNPPFPALASRLSHQGSHEDDRVSQNERSGK